jgi:hypothetical protein
MRETVRSRVILLFLVGLPLLALAERRRPATRDTAAGRALAASPSLAPLEDASAPRPRVDNPRPRLDVAEQAWFVEARQQLGLLGAVYMRLERWDGDYPVYQFRCDLQSASISPPGKTFKALSSSPQAATLHVLQQARQWGATPGRFNVETPSARVASPPIRTLPGALTPAGRPD